MWNLTDLSTFSSFSGADHLRSCTFALIVYICVCVCVCVCVEGDSSAEVFCLWTSYFIVWLPIIQCGQFLVGRCVCVDVQTWICIVARIYESSENRGALLFLVKSPVHTVSGGPEEYCGLWLKEVKEAQSSTWKLKRDKRKAQLIK